MAKSKKHIDSPSVIYENKGVWNHRILVGTPMTGLVRSEWAMARYGQIIPTNWSSMDIQQMVSTHAPLKYLVADAQNIIVKAALEKKSEWLLFIEHDNVIPPDCFIKLNEYMRKGDIPVVGGLYFTKSDPPEPMTYRGVGNSFYTDWKLGDKVWVSGLPMGCTLIHMSLLEKMWEDSPEYVVNGVMLHRVFEVPERVWFDPEHGGYRSEVGTSDLNWCKKVMEGNYLNKCGFKKVAGKKFPFLVDTNIFVKHIDMDGRQFPLQMPPQYLPQ